MRVIYPIQLNCRLITLLGITHNNNYSELIRFSHRLSRQSTVIEKQKYLEVLVVVFFVLGSPGELKHDFYKI